MPSTILSWITHSLTIFMHHVRNKASIVIGTAPKKKNKLPNPSESNKEQWNPTYAMLVVLSCLLAYDNIGVDFPLERWSVHTWSCSESVWKLNITKLLSADHVLWRNLLFIFRLGPDPLGRMEDTCIFGHEKIATLLSSSKIMVTSTSMRWNWWSPVSPMIKWG